MTLKTIQWSVLCIPVLWGILAGISPECGLFFIFDSHAELKTKVKETKFKETKFKETKFKETKFKETKFKETKAKEAKAKEAKAKEAEVKETNVAKEAEAKEAEAEEANVANIAQCWIESNPVTCVKIKGLSCPDQRKDKTDKVDECWRKVFGDLNNSLEHDPAARQKLITGMPQRLTYFFAGLGITWMGVMWLMLRARDTRPSEARFGRYFEMPSYFIWLVPSIGFVGTILGIGQALLNSADMLIATPDKRATAITKVTDQLGLAFDSTLVALIAAMFMMFFYHFFRLLLAPGDTDAAQ